MFFICLNTTFLSDCLSRIPTKHMLGLIGQTIVGRLNGYQCVGISTRASTSFHNGIDKLLSILSEPSEGVCARAH
jgi:hypothetical protein